MYASVSFNFLLARASYKLSLLPRLTRLFSHQLFRSLELRRRGLEVNALYSLLLDIMHIKAGQ